jgi:hypothetical protein
MGEGCEVQTGADASGCPADASGCVLQAQTDKTKAANHSTLARIGMAALHQNPRGLSLRQTS